MEFKGFFCECVFVWGRKELCTPKGLVPFIPPGCPWPCGQCLGGSACSNLQILRAVQCFFNSPHGVLPLSSIHQHVGKLPNIQQYHVDKHPLSFSPKVLRKQIKKDKNQNYSQKIHIPLFADSLLKTEWQHSSLARSFKASLQNNQPTNSAATIPLAPGGSKLIFATAS